MTAPSVVSEAYFPWTGAYPLASSNSYDSTGTDGLIVFFFSATGTSFVPVATYGGVTGTLIGQNTVPAQTSAGTLWAWSFRGYTPGAGTLLISSSTNYADSGCCYVVGLTGTQSSMLGNSSIVVSGTPSGSASITAAGANSTFIGLAASCQAPGVTGSGSPAPTLLESNTTATNNLGNVYSQASVSSGATVSISSSAAYNYTAAAVVEVLGASSGPSITSGPLSLSTSLGAATVRVPPVVTAAPLSLSVSLGSETLVVTPIPPSILAGPLALTISEGGIVVTFPNSITAPPLVLSLGLGAASVGSPVSITAGPLPLTIALGSETVGIAATLTTPITIPAGGSVTVTVRFTPTVAGSRTGALSIVSNAASSPNTVALTGTAVASGPAPLSRLSISGNQFVDSSGNKVRLKSVNWFGGESTNYIPHGNWIRRYTDMLSQMKTMGFNCIRLAFSGDTCSPGRTPPGTAFDATLNPEFVGQTSLQIYDLIIAWCQANSMYVVLDHHRRSAGAGTDTGIVAPYSTTQWQADWVLLATRYAANTCVVGADVHNEPYVYTWLEWKALVEPLGNAILAAAPAWLIFVEGVGAFTGTSNGVTYDNDNTWWGGQLMDVANNPITLSVPHKVVYSPHEYGQSVGSQAWLSTDSSPVTGYPAGIYTEIHKHWGYIYEQGIAPIWVGEMGGKFGLDGSGGATQPNGDVETVWMSTVIKVLNGDFAGTGTSQDTAGNKGMSACYWAYPPISGDTGGLVQDDWTTPQAPKLAVLAPFLTFTGT